MQQPGEFGPREIGVEFEACCFREGWFVAGGAQAIANRSGPAVLPDDCVVERFTRLPVPDDNCLPLVGHADGSEFVSGYLSLGEGDPD